MTSIKDFMKEYDKFDSWNDLLDALEGWGFEITDSWKYHYITVYAGIGKTGKETYHTLQTSNEDEAELKIKYVTTERY